MSFPWPASRSRGGAAGRSGLSRDNRWMKDEKVPWLLWRQWPRCHCDRDHVSELHTCWMGVCLCCLGRSREYWSAWLAVVYYSNFCLGDGMFHFPTLLVLELAEGLALVSERLMTSRRSEKRIGPCYLSSLHHEHSSLARVTQGETK